METTMHLEKQLDTAKESPFFYRVFGLVSLGMLLDAGDVYMASAINASITQSHFASVSQGSLFLSAGFLGLFIGSLIAGIIGDFFGRKHAYQFNLLIFGIFTIISGLAPNIEFLIISRFIAACGLGAEIVTGYAVINEFAPTKTRGRWAGITAVVANLGAPLSLLLAMFLIPQFGWRSLFWTIGGLAIILWFARLHFPESPRWLMSKGRSQEAHEIIEKLATKGFYESQKKSTNSDMNKVSISKGKALLVAIVAVSAVLVSQYTFTSWVPSLLLSQGITIIHSLMFTTIMMLGAPLGALIGAIISDRIGRKKTIIPSFIIAALLGITYAYQTNSFMIMLIGFLLTTTFYILMASVVGMYASELFSTSFRFRGTGIANGIAKLLTVLTPSLFICIIARFPISLVYYLMAALLIFAAIIVAIFGPETRHKDIN